MRFRRFPIVRSTWRDKESFVAVDCKVSDDSFFAGCVILNGCFVDSIVCSTQDNHQVFKLLVPEELVSPRKEIKMIKVNCTFKLL